LRVLAAALLVVALAGPRSTSANGRVPAEGIDAVLALDISGSMTTPFGQGKTRIAAATAAAESFADQRKDDRIGLVVFESTAMAYSPPTLDHDALIRILKDLKNGLLPDGTSIGLGIAEATNMLKESTAASRVIILLTDGEDNTGPISPEGATELAKANGMRLYTIGIVDPKSPDEVDKKRMTAIAESTGGRFYGASDPQALKQVYADIGKLETSRLGREHFEHFIQYGPWLALAAVGLVALELVLGSTWLRILPS
jgi:Ca-activated chloride channel family protein